MIYRMINIRLNNGIILIFIYIMNAIKKKIPNLIGYCKSANFIYLMNCEVADKNIDKNCK